MRKIEESGKNLQVMKMRGKSFQENFIFLNLLF